MSTTRPETMLGDVAVAVHPEDPRYQVSSLQDNEAFWNELECKSALEMYVLINEVLYCKYTGTMIK